jgi:alpha-beta hydrolase superfamily lysophospholipase
MHMQRGTLNKTTLGHLRLAMPLFSDAMLKTSTPIDLLTDYLQFYQLPLATPNLKLTAGTTEDHQTVVMSWEPTKSVGAVIIVHGYTDHTGLYGHLIRHLLDRQLSVVCLDLKGHGLSSGAACSITDFGDYVAQVKSVIALCQAHFEGPLHGIGQSLGGAVLMKHCLNQSAHNAYPFASLTLLAPLLQPADWKKNRRLYYFSRWFVKSIKRVFRPSSWDIEFLAFVRDQDPLQPARVPLDWVGAMDQWISEFAQANMVDYPVHIIQGDNDKTLDWKYNLSQFRLKFNALQVSIIKRANHHLVNEEEALRESIFAKIDL